MSTSLCLGLVTDLHFGTNRLFRGRLCKLSEAAPSLLRDVVRRMNDDVKPDALVNLGDDIENTDEATDRSRYSACQALLRGFRGARIDVAGNHDCVHLSPAWLAQSWGRTGPLHYSAFVAGVQLIVLHTEQPELRQVHIAAAQLEWLKAQLASATAPAVVLMHHSASEQDVSTSRWFAGIPEAALVRERAELRRILERSGRVRAVVNGHLHRNHLDVINGIPYVTVQSLVENVEEDAPGVPAAAYAVLRLDARYVVVDVAGARPVQHRFEARG